MKNEVELEIEYDDKEITVVGKIVAAEPDVGLMSPGLEDVKFYDAFGVEIIYTEEEEERILNSKAFQDAFQALYYGDEGDY